MSPDPSSTHDPHDPFAALGLERRFDMPSASIESAFLERLRGVHPDLAGEDASLDAADLTRARATLADHEERAVALLALLGGPSASEDKSLPDGFLMEMMELRGEIEEELVSDAGARDRWQAFADERRAGHIGRVSELFQTDPMTDGTLGEIRMELNAWRYTERLIEQLDPDYDPAHADGVG